MTRRTISKPVALLVAGDILVALGALHGVAAFLAAGAPSVDGWLVRDLTWTGVLVFCSYMFELYVPETNYDRKSLLAHVTAAISVSFGIFAVLLYLSQRIVIGRTVLFAALLMFIVGQCLWHWVFARFHFAPEFGQHVLVVGTGKVAAMVGALISDRNQKYYLAGYYACSAEKVEVPEEQIVGRSSALIDIAHAVGANRIVLALSDRRGKAPVRELLDCKMAGIDVLDMPTFYEILHQKLMIGQINPSAIIFSDGFRITEMTKICKRLFDLCCSFGMLLCVLPFFPLIGLAVLFDSSGPVFFRQVRIGEGSRPFTLYKFRTMQQDAEKKSGAVWAQKNDPRVTRIGRFLRASRLDELPQLWNVLRGDMSFVGPRPERPEFVGELIEKIPYYAERHAIKPGLTGWAQVRYAYGASIEDTYEKLSYDLYYIKHISVVFDLIIVLETVKVVLFGRGAR